ncbi:DEAD/DEAH box helicase [Adlercreutzia sp. ZJ141]|uniref:DEAD/DEAH box helicase n=1 Tax=Adlercreutzia sp. ZJ141 TaxID=2709406 RepID=UPI0013EAAAFA|nr:DEAD/DEAH box helicase [Adlercreutzia sp. ZJ141]
MITTWDVEECCTSRTFQRAKQLARRVGGITKKRCGYDTGLTYLSGYVLSSDGWSENYRVDVELDENTDEVYDYSCTCPAAFKYDGMCKHAAALALVYLDNPTAFKGYRPDRTPETSPSIDAYIKRISRVRAERESLIDPVGLDAFLSYDYGDWSVRFKVRGPRASYVMKSISSFLDAVHNAQFVTYGKKLAFTHAPAAFDEHARKIIDFLERAVENRTRLDNFLFWHNRARALIERDLSLSDVEVIELLDLLADYPFELSCSGPSLTTRLMVEIRQCDPCIPLKIERSSKGGYVIDRTSDIVFVAVHDRMYVLQDDGLYNCSPSFARCADFLRNVYESSDDELYIAPVDAPLFCAAALPLLEETLDVQAPSEFEQLRPVPVQFEFYFDYAKKTDLIEIEALARYGERSFPITLDPKAQVSGAAAGAGASKAATAGAAPAAAEVEAAAKAEAPTMLRDEVLERRAASLVREFFEPDATLPLGDGSAAGKLLFGGLSQFREMGEVFTTPAFDRLTSDKRPHVTMGVSLAGNLINLDVSSSDLPPDELAALLAGYRRRRRYHRLSTGALLNLTDLDFSDVDRLVDDTGLSVGDLARGRAQLPAYRALYLDDEFESARRDESFESYVARLRAVDQSSYQVPPSLNGVLRPYQVEGFQWLSALADMGFGGILADEMGLGKSVQLISFLLARAEAARAVGPSLIVCPASLVYNWLAEFARFAPELSVRAMEGPKLDRYRIRTESGIDVLVASYDITRMDIDDLEQLQLYCCVLDEAQYVKNHTALTTRAVKRLRAQHRFALTGTPVENRLSEAWSIFDFLMPGFLSSYMRFRERYELGIVGGDEELSQRLQALLGPFILRRRKAGVLTELPEKIESVVRVALGSEQRRLYDAAEQQLRQELTVQKKASASRKNNSKNSGKNGGKNDAASEKSRVEVLAELTRLRQIALDPALAFENYQHGSAKTDAVIELVQRACDAGEKVLVFSQFTSYLARFADELKARELSYFRITGSTSKKERVRLVDRFNTDDTPVFLISLKAGGTGLNLTGASVVVHADPWWNAAATNQATDRAHRIGQRHAVSVYKVIAAGTVEERILKLQEAKAELAENVLGAAGASLSALTSEELLDLLEG